ncbi:MAG: SIMPL domain-containing protein [bacterium]|nr:SIMPL domain-containing protein [bacterium]
MDEHKLFVRPPVWLPIIVALIAGGLYITGKHVENMEPPPVISVQGQGKIQAVPDIALLNFGVQTGRQKSAQAAMEMLGKRMTAAFDALKELGIEEKDIMTQSLNLNPAYDWNEGKRIDRGFEANQNLQVKVRDLDKITTVLDVAVRMGANQVGGVSFTIDDMDELREEAREMAIADAQKKAKDLAHDLGQTLGRFRGFNEGGGYNEPYPMMRMESMAMDAKGIGGGTPVPAGEQEIVVNVNLMYEVK